MSLHLGTVRFLSMVFSLCTGIADTSQTMAPSYQPISNHIPQNFIIIFVPLQFIQVRLQSKMQDLCINLHQNNNDTCMGGICVNNYVLSLLLSVCRMQKVLQMVSSQTCTDQIDLGQPVLVHNGGNHPCTAASVVCSDEFPC